MHVFGDDSYWTSDGSQCARRYLAENLNDQYAAMRGDGYFFAEYSHDIRFFPDLFSDVGHPDGECVSAMSRLADLVRLIGEHLRQQNAVQFGTTMAGLAYGRCTRDIHTDAFMILNDMRDCGLITKRQHKNLLTVPFAYKGSGMLGPLLPSGGNALLEVDWGGYQDRLRTTVRLVCSHAGGKALPDESDVKSPPSGPELDALLGPSDPAPTAADSPGPTPPATFPPNATIVAPSGNGEAPAPPPVTGGQEGKPQKGKIRGGDGVPVTRPWTQRDLDRAIREYKAKRAATYSDFLAVLQDPKGPSKGKTRAKKAARELFGRNVIARALEVRSTSMVSKSEPWKAIAEELGFSLARNRIRGTRNTRKPGPSGLDIAVEEKSQAPTPEADNRPSDAPLENDEREETLRIIRLLAEKKKKEAEAIYNKYDAGEMTDEQARQAVDTLMAPGE